jgi:type III restriction enzyme
MKRFNTLDYQLIAKRQLLEHLFYIVKNIVQRQEKVVFKAPTGAGKTIVMCETLYDFSTQIKTNNYLQNRNFAYIWLAPNELHYQSLTSFRTFFEDSRVIRPITFNDITDDKLLPHDLLFLNWQSISNEGNILIRENETGRNLPNFINTTKIDGTEIIVIIDEAHLYGTKGEKALQVLRLLDAKIEIDISATPLTRSDYEVIIKRQEVVNAQMIKKGVHLNPNISQTQQGKDDADIALLKTALAKRKELAYYYEAIGEKINPLLLVQLPSETQKLTESDNEIKTKVVEYLATQGLTMQNHRVAIWLSNDKVNLEGIEQPNNMVDVLLFKQAIALGWDCPRAAVLVAFRELNHPSFSIQTLGRILRMPQQKHYVNEALNYGYVFTNLQSNIIQIQPDEIDYFPPKPAYRKEMYEEQKLSTHFMESTLVRNRIGLHFKTALFRTAEKMYGLLHLGDTPDAPYFTNIEIMKNRLVDVLIKDVHIQIPENVYLDGTDVSAISVEKTANFAKTNYQLEQLFNRFCIQSCDDYQKDGSWERIKYHTKLLFLEYFGVDDYQTYKAVLSYPQFFTDLLNIAIEEYGRIMEQVAKNKTSLVKEELWEVPLFKIYSHQHVAYDFAEHILDPLYVRKKEDGTLTDSINEFEFIQYLESNKPYIHWWYKNGTTPKIDFAVAYINTQGQESLFYPDILMLLKNGTLCFFDPKTPESDKNMVAKHNALINYMDKHKTNTKKMVGGIALHHKGTWRYASKTITNAFDVNGWEVLHFQT